MEKKSRSFEDYVEKSILINNEFGITKVNRLESVKSTYLNRDQYPQIVSLIQENNLSEIRQLPLGDITDEFLEIMQFEDQNQEHFVVTVYDSTAITQDPQVIDLFKVG